MYACFVISIFLYVDFQNCSLGRQVWRQAVRDRKEILGSGAHEKGESFDHWLGEGQDPELIFSLKACRIHVTFKGVLLTVVAPAPELFLGKWGAKIYFRG